MKSIQQSCKKKDYSSLYILISILFHLALLLLFLRYAFREQNPFVRQQQKQYDTDITFELPPELRPRKGTLDETQDIVSPSQSVSLIQQQTIPQPHEEEKAQPVEEKQTPQLQPEKKEGTPRLSKVELKQFALQNLLKKKPPQEEKIEEKQQHPLMPQPTLQNSPQNLSFSIPMGTAIDHETGHDLAQRAGDPTKRPSAEELKYISYIRRIAKLISDNIRFLINHRFTDTIEVTFEFDKKGYIQACSSQSTTQRCDLADKVMETIKELSPLPPIPDHWNCESVMPTVTLYWSESYSQPALYSCYSFAAYKSTS